jgi:hypothetical protein
MTLVARDSIKAYHNRAVSKWHVKYTFDEFLKFLGTQLAEIQKVMSDDSRNDQAEYNELFADIADDFQGRVPSDANVLRKAAVNLALNPGFFDSLKGAIFDGSEEFADKVVDAVDTIGESSEETFKAVGFISKFLPIILVAGVALYLLSLKKRAGI